MGKGVPDDRAEPWRLFFAIPMPPADALRLVDALEPYAAAFPSARWQRPDAYHVTVWFLGATPPDRVPGLVDLAQRCTEGGVPFRMSTGSGDGLLRGTGSVAWCRIVQGEHAASRVSGCLVDDPVSGPPGAPPAPPHLTVARRVDAALIEALRSESLGPLTIEWMAASVVLYRSHTGTLAGSSYEPLAEIAL